jgi:hypothetical protein
MRTGTLCLVVVSALIGCGGSNAVDPDAGTSGDARPDAPDPVFPVEHPRVLLHNAERTAQLRDALAMSTRAAARFKETVELAVSGGDVYAFPPWNAALLSQLEQRPELCTWAVDQIDQSVTAEEALIAGGERPLVSGDSYLEVGEYIGNLALVYDWCFSAVSDSQRTRWIAYANQAVWNVWHHEDAQWGGQSFPWSGWSVDNPVNNYYYSFLRATMLLGLATRGENPEAEGWITKFRDEKIGGELVPMFNELLAGGGSREGTGYGVAMASLFHLYDLWQATTGENIADLTPHARASMPWMIHAIVPTLDRLAPIGDHARDSTAALFDYHRNYLQILATLYRDDPWAPIARGLLANSSVPEMSMRFMAWADFLYEDPTVTPAPLASAWPAYYAAGTGYAFARSDWSSDATWLELSAGPYTESHAHHDQGQLLVYKREWLAYDANISSHSGIVQDEEAHNLVRLSRAGTALRMSPSAGTSAMHALQDDADLTHLAGDLAPAYPASAGVTRDQREVVFIKPNAIVVFDRIEGDPAAGALITQWQLNTPFQPTSTSDSAEITGEHSTLRVWSLAPGGPPSVAPISQTIADCGSGYRVTWTSEQTGATYFLTVLSLDDDVVSASVSNASGQRGVQLSLSGDRSALVRFNEATWGGSLELHASDGSTRSVTLGESVAQLPLLVP